MDTWLNQDRYKSYSECSDKLIIKKLCILNELYLYSVLKDFDISSAYNLKDYLILYVQSISCFINN